jgi:hypothetical protein
VGSFVREKKREKKFKGSMKKIFLGSEHFRSLHGGHLGQCEFSSEPMQVGSLKFGGSPGTHTHTQSM